MSSRLEAILHDIETTLASGAPEMHSSLRSSAATDQLDALERAFGHTLLPEIRTLYSWHDGAEGGIDAFPLSDDFIFISMSQSVSEKSTMDQIVGETFVNPQDAEWLWRSMWLPIGSSYAGSLLVVDHHPGEACGQVFPVEHGNGARLDRAWHDIAALLNHNRFSLRGRFNSAQ